MSQESDERRNREAQRPAPEELLKRYGLRDRNLQPSLLSSEEEKGQDRGPQRRGRLRVYLGAVAGVEVAGDAFVFKDDSPGNSGGIDGEEGAAGVEGKRLHTLTIR